jgi:hypothetical protein
LIHSHIFKVFQVLTDMSLVGSAWAMEAASRRLWPSQASQAKWPEMTTTVDPFQV